MATVFEAETGRILFYTDATLPRHMQNLCTEAGQIVVEGSYSDALFYMDAGEPVPRPLFTAMPDRSLIADGVHKTTISGLPAGTVLRFEGEDTPIEDGRFEFITAVPGVYRFRFSAPFPWREQIVTVTAHAP